MTARAGSALILIGLIALVVFLIMLAGGTFDVLVLLGGSALAALGLLLRRRATCRERYQKAGAFHTMRRLFGRGLPEKPKDVDTM